jgi:hypothetical protein
MAKYPLAPPCPTEEYKKATKLNNNRSNNSDVIGYFRVIYPVF